jgi:hypothetical protein
VRQVLLLAALLVLTGCAGDDGEDVHGGAESLRAFLVAVSDGDRQSAAEQVSGTVNLLDVDLRGRVPRKVEIPPAEDFVVLRNGSVTVAATELETEFGAYAAPVRREQDTWKVDFPTKALRVVEGPPVPNSGVGPDQRVGFAVYSSDPDLGAALWIDGEQQKLAGAGGPEFTRYWATPELAPGAHIAVALARATGEAAAVAWRFTVGLPG